jgi:5-formaminoimidazole-4-carboxamide-1-(beta)-D-ribofuranosyl 5'-monophosphate synthetase
MSVDFSQYTIATLGSHSSLQILKGAKDEGFKTLVITKSDRESFYKRFSFIDKQVGVATYKDYLALDPQFKDEKVILIPHGSFVAYLGMDGNKQIQTPYFGNKKVLDWEADRNKQIEWLRKANILVPRTFTPGDLNDQIDRPVIVKSYGAAGGVGYFIAHNQKDFERKIQGFDKQEFIIQEYIIGVPMYLSFFYSPLTKKVELLGIDRRYETNVDSLGRLPLAHQESIEITPSFVVVGNSPLVVRESLLPEAYDMAERLVKSSQELINEQGLFGPFCIETIVTPEQKFYAVEVSCRIVAGTNLFIDSNPYGALLYDEPMSMGRRIARELKHAIEQDRLAEVLN